MTEKIIFAYTLFLSLNISDFIFFFMWKLHPPPPPWKKSLPSFPATPSKSWVPVKPPLLKTLLEVQTTQQNRGGGCTLCLIVVVSMNSKLKGFISHSWTSLRMFSNFLKNELFFFLMCSDFDCSLVNLLSPPQILKPRKTALFRFRPNEGVTFLIKIILYNVFLPSVTCAHKNVWKYSRLHIFNIANFLKIICTYLFSQPKSFSSQKEISETSNLK